jgi:hypothetical protein
MVGGWYQTYLGRSPVNAEEQGWVAALLHGASEDTVLAGILGSEEFLRRAESLTSSGTAEQRYVQFLYSLLLQRTGSAAEVNGWIPAITSASRAAVALGFLRSPEYRSDAVQTYYGYLLRRATVPSPAEVTLWVNSGLELTTIRADFLESAEFTLNG